MKKIVFVIVLISFALVVSSCAAGPNQLRNTPDEVAKWLDFGWDSGMA